jgi:hypothetical protein
MERRNFLKLVAAGMAIASTKLRSAMAADQTDQSRIGRSGIQARKYRLSESAGITSAARW